MKEEKREEEIIRLLELYEEKKRENEGEIRRLESILFYFEKLLEKEEKEKLLKAIKGYKKTLDLMDRKINALLEELRTLRRYNFYKSL